MDKTYYAKKYLIPINDSDIDWDNEFNQDEKNILRGINQRVVKGMHLDEILDFVFDEASKILPLDRLDVAFLDDDNTRLVLYYTKTSYNDIHLLRGYSSDIQGGSIQVVLNTGYPSIINDLASHLSSYPKSESAQLLLKEGIHSSIASPLKVDNRDVGIIMFRSKQINAYTMHHIKLLLAFRDRLAQAVEKTYHIEKLTATINAYMEMLGFITHELKNPLASIITLGRTIASGYFGEISDKNKEMVNRIVKKTEYLHNIALEYLNLARFESGVFNTKFSEVNFFEEIVTSSIDFVETNLNEKKMKIILHNNAGNIKVLCDPELMKIVMNNLLSNAIKYGYHNGQIILLVTADENIIHVSVKNDGPGFPESEKVKLFKKFSRLNTPELMDQSGHGVGLYVTWKIIQMHSGHIWAHSEQGKWAEFTFEIPLRMDQCLIQPSRSFQDDVMR
ncbi:MAG TPA: GAF domain-containing sensor histidine kinase [Spirochaetota bacterium]|nr:GAF domain-containing sensor histidine kinase [Spirochaetota bacterium]HOM10180.1 GAF domain-containing sensor histidine kinase [Spirochaetota bacterium]HPP48780.1 GAF domain-containing sensor histidine kinase [Spirochaetota bacterium]